MADEYGRTADTASTGTRLVASTDGSDPSQPHPQYHVAKARRDRVRMLWDGTEAVRNAGEDALPKYDGESDADYEKRRDLSGVHPALGETVEVSVGLLLTQPPTLDADVPDVLREWWENVDARGNAGPVFCTQLCTDGLLDGMVGIFTDMPTVQGRTDLDVARAKELGLRPWWIPVLADDVFMEVYDAVDGADRLVLFIRREVTTKRLGDFGIETVYRYHVYEDVSGRITARTYETDRADARPTLVQNSEVVLEKQPEIPWSPIVGGRILSDGTISPPLHELAFLVLEHHFVKTGRLSLASLAFAPTMVVINAPRGKDGSDPDINTGPRAVIHARFAPGESIPANPVYYTQPDVGVLTPAKDMLENIEGAMSIAGRGFLSPDKRGVEAAKSKQLSNRAGNASLSRFAGRLQDALPRSLQHVANYYGLGPLSAGGITVSRTFEEALMESDVMNAYAKLVESGLPVRLAFRALKLQGRIQSDAEEDEFVMEWELARMAKQEADRIEAIPVQDDPENP